MHIALLDSSGGAAAGLGAAFFVFFLLGLAVAVFYIACLWKIFTKAGRPGWLSIIPIVNTVYLLIIAGQSGWLILLTLIPGIGGLILAFVLYLNLAKVFGKGTGFGLGLIFLGVIFLPILAFDNSRYLGVPQRVMMVAQPYPQQQPYSQPYPQQPPQQPYSQPYPQQPPQQYPQNPQNPQQYR